MNKTVVVQKKLSPGITIVDDFIDGVYASAAARELSVVKTYENMRYSHLSKKEQQADLVPARNSTVNPKIQNNDPCSCGSGRKYKRCCKCYLESL